MHMLSGGAGRWDDPRLRVLDNGPHQCISIFALGVRDTSTRTIPMDLTPKDLDRVRDYTGSTPDDGDLHIIASEEAPTGRPRSTA